MEAVAADIQIEEQDKKEISDLDDIIEKEVAQPTKGEQESYPNIFDIPEPTKKADEHKKPTPEEHHETYGKVSKSKRGKVTLADTLIQTLPQTAMPANGYYEPEGRIRMILWNSVGSVSIREDQSICAIDVDVANSTKLSAISIKDDIGVSMAALSYKGVLLASRGKEENLDEYEDEEEEEFESSKKGKLPVLLFKNLTTGMSSSMLSDWRIDFPPHEFIDVISMGSNFCAVATSLQDIRIFSVYGGVQLHLFSLPTQILTMTSYENHLSLFYHNGPPMYRSQNIKFSTLDVEEKYRTVTEGLVSLSIGSTLNWCGYSEDGQLYTLDSEGTLRGHFSEFGSLAAWKPVWEFE